ncbi:MAG: ATP-binding cassette domain-containing protein, partial [Gemmatimonadaceae bacterium]
MADPPFIVPVQSAGSPHRGGPATGSPPATPGALAATGATMDGAAIGDARHSLALSWTALRRGRRPVLAPADVRLPAGAVVGLVGANGAGKSTLLTAVAGVLAARCGRAWALADGRAIPTVGYLPQHPTLAPWLSVRDALALHGVDAAATLAATPSLGALAALLDRRSDALSGGQT